jgi:hypothetical protein
MAIEFLKKEFDNSPSGCCVVQFSTYEALTKAIAMDGRELRGMALWAVKDIDGIRTLSVLKNLGHKHKPKTDKIHSNIPLVSEDAIKNLDFSMINNIKDALNSLAK